MTTYGSLFFGVGGFDLGCDAAGWECAWQVEWDARARSVLARHWPNVLKHCDVRDVTGHDLAPVDVITFGFPCQDLSVAGKRAGLDGERSGLFFEAIRIIDEMRKATNGAYPRVVVAENVTGLLNADRGDAMGRCLDALAEVGALAIEWRVLDAQWFGVPQRRRRVFLVACFNPGAASAGPVFPEPESVRGDLAPVRTPGKGIAGSLTGGLGTGGPDAAHALNGWLTPADATHTHTHTHTHRGDLDAGRASGVVQRPGRLHGSPHPQLAGTVSAKWAKGTGGPSGDECQNLVLDTRDE